ncbi:MAG: carbamoyltransferase HypF [Candidatus Helarchaeota archaeon]|nr:carbamoyltransferase HypF [Candidatus Helarchaeota archaeon]
MKCTIHVSGIVQGVGFRPFIYRQATSLNLLGYVLNLGNKGVKIEIEGTKEKIERFIKEIKENHPPISRIDDIEVQWIEEESGYKEFKILKSLKSSGDSIVLPPDISICDDCLNDFKNEKYSRYYRYPFIACSVCGPRYTTVTDLPYDRPFTTMIEFPFCKDCNIEYTDPKYRRYHAQTFACNVCGPHFKLYNKNGTVIDEGDPFKTAVKLLKENHIVALMGNGGVHLVSRAIDETILELRRRKRKRKFKPFAVMSPSIDTIKTYAIVSPKEEKLLNSFRRPIVLLEKSPDYYLSEEISPGLTNIGVFLPYSGMHYLLFENNDFPALIMTSGNISNLPMATDRHNVLEELKGIADYFLLHNRKIHQRSDDSVLFLLNNKTTIIRRSRGFVPEHIELPFSAEDVNLVAVGPELHSTASVLKKNRIYPSQHIGDVNSLEILDFLDESIIHLTELLKMQSIDAYVCDYNPVFLSTKLAQRKAKEYSSRLIQVQHHHAHAAAIMAEYKINPDNQIIGIILDGVGYGKDGKAWGGEIFLSNYENFERMAYLEYHPMPAGDRCVYYPVRMLSAILSEKLSSAEIRNLVEKEYLEGLPHGKNELEVLLKQIESKTNLAYTSGTGRVLDALAALLKICFERTYEGEPAIRLEHYAKSGNPKAIKFKIPLKSNKETIIETSDLILQALEHYRNGIKPQDIAASAQFCLSSKIAEIAVNLAKKEHIKHVGLSGGVAYNKAMTINFKNYIEKQNLAFLQHELIPPGDAGVSIGQAIVGARLLKK